MNDWANRQFENHLDRVAEPNWDYADNSHPIDIEISSLADDYYEQNNN